MSPPDIARRRPRSLALELVSALSERIRDGRLNVGDKMPTEAAIMRYVQPLGGSTLTWRAGVDNLFDRRAWRESPYQYEHAYLFPTEPRTFHASIEAKF